MDRLHIFLNGDRGMAVLQALVKNGHRLDGVYVPAKGSASAILESTIRKLGLTPEAIVDVNAPTFVEKFAAQKPRLAIIAGYSTIFKEPVFSTPELGTINCHAGRVPAYRGGSPLNWQIMNGEQAAGISVLQVDAGIDSGDVLAEAELPIGSDDDIASLHEKANQSFPKLVAQTVARFDAGDYAGRAQDAATAAYWHQRNDEDGHIDWRHWTAQRVHDAVRALTTPYPGAWTEFNGSKLRVLRTSLDVPRVNGMPGRIVHVSGLGPLVVCADRALKLVAWRFGDGTSPKLSSGMRLS